MPERGMNRAGLSASGIVGGRQREAEGGRGRQEAVSERSACSRGPAEKAGEEHGGLLPDSRLGSGRRPLAGALPTLCVGLSLRVCHLEPPVLL